MNSKEPQDNGFDRQDVRDKETNKSDHLDHLDHLAHLDLLHNADVEAEDLSRYIYKTTTAAICAVEVVGEGEYIYLDFNPMCQIWLGSLTEKLKGKSPQDIFPPSDLKIVVEAYDSCVRSQQIYSYEKCSPIEDKSSYWITTLSPQVDEEGKVYRLISTSVNLSERQQIKIAIQRAELHKEVESLNITPEAQVEQRTTQLRSTLAELQQLLQSEELIRSITQAIRDSLDEKQILQTATRSLTEGLKVECCQIELYKYHHTITEVICEYPIVLPDSEGIHRQVNDFPELYNLLLNKKSIHFVDWLPSIGYRQQQATRLACPIFDDRGILGNLWLMRTKDRAFEPREIKLVEQIADQCAIAIRQARLYKTEQIQVKELEKLNIVKDDFLKTISHELRTPMSRLRLAISTLENLLEAEIGAYNSARINKVMDIFHTSFRKHNQLVDDLLTLCYVDATSKPDLWQVINLQTWIPQIVKTFSLDINQHTLQLDLGAELPPLRSDSKMLKRVINELLNNAYKYTPEGGKIIIKTEKNLTQLFIKVINTNVEIPVEEQERIFDKFYRIPNSDPWKHGGTGIGLALVKKLVELLEGNITVTSEQKITTFTLAFPVN